MPAKKHTDPEPSERHGNIAFDHRPDEVIWDEVHEQLNENPDIDASEIEVTVEDGEVTLTGRVESREARWLIEEIVERVAGVQAIHNRLKIARR